MKWYEYEIHLTSSEDLDALMKEENDVVFSLLPYFTETEDVFWSGYFGPGYHKLRFGIKTEEDKSQVLFGALPQHKIDVFDPLQEDWAHDVNLYNAISDIKAKACLISLKGFGLQKPYNPNGMTMFIHFFLNALGYPYREEALICSRNTYQALFQQSEIINNEDLLEVNEDEST